jgi:Sulfotransferase domain/N-terminal domain of galactosyltransferase
MQSSPKIIFVSTCKGRVEHLKKTLSQNILHNADYENCRFVVLDYNSQDGLQDYLKETFSPLNVGKLSIYTHLAPGPFNVSHAKNMAMRCAILEGADILVTLDADNYTGPGFAQFIADRFREAGAWVGQAPVFPGIFLCPNFPLIKSLPHGPESGRPDRGYAGRFAIKAKDFVKMGGYDESFDTWHGEDVDMISRLGRLDYSMRHIDNQYLKTIPHGPEVRFKEYPHARQFENDREWKVIDARTTTVVNYGKWGLGTAYKNYDFTKPIEFEPLPTRIFGIGMHKTGTTTLHHALQILGFDSFHWGTGEAPIIWNEMELDGRSKTLEQWYALSDLPIPLLYEKLDKTYPGSKFILTIRNEQDWLKSVEALWDHGRNSTRWVWDVYPFTNRIHRELYGQKHFDKEVMLARYRRHNEEVKRYFKGRPDDLLIMNIDRKPGWPTLCDFLNVDQPSAPYPYSNPTPAQREYKKLAQSGESYCEPEAKQPRNLHPLNEFTRALLEDWAVVAERVPEASDIWIEEDSQGSGIMHYEKSVPRIGKAASTLPISSRLIVVERERDEPSMIAQAKALAVIPPWRDLDWWENKRDLAVDYARSNYRLIVIFVLAILFGLLVGAGLARLMK